MPLHPVCVGSAKGIPAASSSQYTVHAVLRIYGLISQQSRYARWSIVAGRVDTQYHIPTLPAAGFLIRPEGELLVAFERRTTHSRTFHLQRDSLRDK